VAAPAAVTERQKRDAVYGTGIWHKGNVKAKSSMKQAHDMEKNARTGREVHEKRRAPHRGAEIERYEQCLVLLPWLQRHSNGASHC